MFGRLQKIFEPGLELFIYQKSVLEFGIILSNILQKFQNLTFSKSMEFCVIVKSNV